MKQYEKGENSAQDDQNSESDSDHEQVKDPTVIQRYARKNLTP